MRRHAPDAITSHLLKIPTDGHFSRQQRYSAIYIFYDYFSGLIIDICTNLL